MKLFKSGTRRKLTGGKRVQHVALLSLPGLEENAEDLRAFNEIIARLNQIPGVKASFHRYGLAKLDKEALMQYLQKPDVSHGMTHCLLLVTDDLKRLRDYYHGPIQTKELSPLIGKYFRGAIAVDTELGLDLPARAPGSEEEPILQFVFLRFQSHVTKESAVYKSFEDAVAEFRKQPGVRASLSFAGYAELNADELAKALEWPDRRMGHTHCLTIAAESVEKLKGLHGSEAYGKWMRVEAPHLINDGFPPVAIFYVPLQVEATAH